MRAAGKSSWRAASASRRTSAAGAARALSAVAASLQGGPRQHCGCASSQLPRLRKVDSCAFHASVGSTVRPTSPQGLVHSAIKLSCVVPAWHLAQPACVKSQERGQDECWHQARQVANWLPDSTYQLPCRRWPSALPAAAWRARCTCSASRSEEVAASRAQMHTETALQRRHSSCCSPVLCPICTAPLQPNSMSARPQGSKREGHRKKSAGEGGRVGAGAFRGCWCGPRRSGIYSEPLQACCSLRQSSRNRAAAVNRWALHSALMCHAAAASTCLLPCSAAPFLRRQCTVRRRSRCGPGTPLPLQWKGAGLVVFRARCEQTSKARDSRQLSVSL